MRFALALGVALLACTTNPPPPAVDDSQVHYTYPGCESGRSYCPNDETFYCAIESEKSRFDACVTADECVSVMVNNCLDFPGCGQGIPVNGSHRAELEAAFERETQRYCGKSGCRESGSCVAVVTSLVCDSGHCQLRAVDGGT